jgi:ABC-type polysaccharide/polyol phosphate transport system ATPase subunit
VARRVSHFFRVAWRRSIFPQVCGWAGLEFFCTTPRRAQVHKWFGRVEVLKGLDLEVGRREVMCIVGPSGSGKSTFLRCVNHLETFDSGRLSVDGELVGMICRRRPPWQPTLSYGRACRRCGVS